MLKFRKIVRLFVRIRKNVLIFVIQLQVKIVKL